MQLYQRFRHPNPAISIAYDALNRPTNMVDAVGTTSYGYDAVVQLLSEDGPWASDSVAYGYTARMRTSLSLQQPNANPWNQTYGYDGARRLTSTASPAGSFGYAYDPNRKLLVSGLSLPNTANITNAYDANARLLGTALVNSGGTNLDAYTYTYNVGNQRTTVTRTLGDVVSYGYDGISQLTSASAKELGGVTNRLQEQFGYGYDAAHNLEFRTNNALIQTFNVNSLNELTTVTRNSTNALTVTGTTGAKATSVTVNGLFASTYNDSTFAEGGFTPVDGNNTYTAIAQDALGRHSTNSVTVFLPASATYTYDLNGNLLSDGTRGFNYDDENQLTNVLVTNAWMSQFVYDGRLRRRIRKEYAWQGGAWVETNEVHYVYDGNLVIQERDINNLPLTTYTRGNDLSGSLQGAGGIGGLLAMSQPSTVNPQHYYYHTDGNGNITALVNSFQAIAAKYLYDPYGTLLSQSGIMASVNLYRYSSKEYHPASGLFYYLYRYYDSTIQKWINRDPLEYNPNLYNFVDNDPILGVDYLGLYNLVFNNLDAAAQARATQAISDAGKIAQTIHDEAASLLKKDDVKKCQQLADQLNKLLDITQNIVNGVNSKDKLYVNQKMLTDEYAETVIPFLFGAPTLYLNTTVGKFNWSTASTSDLDPTVFHELSHIYGTEDDDSLGAFINAHELEKFAQPGGIENSTEYKAMKQDCCKNKRLNNDAQKQTNGPSN